MKLNQFAVYRVDQQTAECVDYCRKLPISLDS